ncbi:MAG: LodA/GoxA family CTQ-dependent oxidase [Bryobacterales bacterium]|nr:LodA/GoxA family CTQ-dependent oxidase [Bryobacterales bacterium]
MPPIYRIHPFLGIARLGDSPDEFCISPEEPATLPLACDSEGNPLRTPDGKSGVAISRFKDAQGRIKRQAARFQVYVYDDQSPEGRPLNLGDAIEGGGNNGTLVDIQWRVWLANKKAAWYQFDGLAGEHGYADDHPLRNAAITDPMARRQLMIDPGPRFVNTTNRRRAAFDRNGANVYAPIFPPKELTPNSIDTLGDILTDDSGRLLVLAGHGNSGSVNSGLGQPRIDDYANTDGWFDDTSDGPVMARLVMFSQEVGRQRYIDVECPAWVIAGYPRYAPEILDMITLDDVVTDLAIRKFAYRTDLYGVPETWDDAPKIDPSDREGLMIWNSGPLDWNPGYKPWFWRDIWPILFRADEMRYLNNVLQQSNYPHDQTQRGNFDPSKLSVPPFVSPRALRSQEENVVRANQSGQLLLDAIETQLLVFDDVIDQALRRRARPSSSETPSAETSAGVNLSQEIRVARAAVRALQKQYALEPRKFDPQLLKQAAATFAEAVLPNGEGLASETYVERWNTLYMQSEDAYEQAKLAMAASLDDVLEPFIEDAIRRWTQAVTQSASLTARLRALQASGSTPSGDSEVIAEVVRASVKGIASQSSEAFRTGRLMKAGLNEARSSATNDPYRDMRTYLYGLLRKPGEENVFRTGGKPTNRLFRLPLMPLLAGDNPVSNELPSKFLRLTDYQIYILRQWADGKFFNEVDEGWVSDAAIDPWQPYANWTNTTPRQLDQGVLSNLLGGAFFPGAEVCWVIRNPAIYLEPFRLKADPTFSTFGQTAANANANAISEQEYLGISDTPLSQHSDFETGLQPGDLTKYSALPWQADFNECTTQTIDITYELWNSIDPSSEGDDWMKREQKTWEALWWPAHRPLQVFEVVSVQNGNPSYQFLGWSRGVPQTEAGDLKMVTEWSRLGFVIRNPYLSPGDIDAPSPNNKYISVERNGDNS